MTQQLFQAILIYKLFDSVYIVYGLHTSTTCIHVGALNTNM